MTILQSPIDRLVIPNLVTAKDLILGVTIQTACLFEGSLGDYLVESQVMPFKASPEYREWHKSQANLRVVKLKSLSHDFSIWQFLTDLGVDPLGSGENYHPSHYCQLL